jgi:TctA family transporter
MCLLFGVGWFMKRYGWPRVPIILGLVLAEPLEKYMWLSLNTYGVAMLARPQVWIIFALALSSLLLSLRAQRATRSIDIASSVPSANERSAPSLVKEKIVTARQHQAHFAATL